MKKNLKLSQFLVGALLIATVAPVSGGVTVDQPQKASATQNWARRHINSLVAQYKELKELRAKRKAGKATPEEIKRIEQQMAKIKKAAIALAITAALITATVGGRYWYKRHQQIQQKEHPEKAARAGRHDLVLQYIAAKESAGEPISQETIGNALMEYAKETHPSVQAQNAIIALIEKLDSPEGYEIDPDPSFILEKAIRHNNTWMVRWLLTNKKALSEAEIFHNTQQAAFTALSVEMLKILLPKLQENYYHQTIARNAVHGKNLPVIKHLVEEENLDPNDSHLLGSAAYAGAADVVDYLLKRPGIETDAAELIGSVISGKKNARIFQILLEHFGERIDLEKVQKNVSQALEKAKLGAAAGNQKATLDIIRLSQILSIISKKMGEPSEEKLAELVSRAHPEGISGEIGVRILQPEEEE